MANTITIGIAILIVIRIGKACFDLRRNIQIAKRSGFPYVVGPFFPITYRWMIIAEFLELFLRKIPGTDHWVWLDIIDRQATYRKPRAVEKILGDTYMVVSSGEFFLKTSNAELITQITARRLDFPKPVWRFTIVDIFGKSILTAEQGEEWKRHHKIVGPTFSEKSNRLVFEESLRQAEGMLSFWKDKSGDKGLSAELRLKDTSGDTATLTLHVICAAGFGIPQLWENQGVDSLDGRALPGFSDDKLTGGHTLSFKKSLMTILSHILWFMVFPPRLLRKLPFEGARVAATAFFECMEYFHTLVEIKRKQMSLDEDENSKTVDLLGPMIKANDIIPIPLNKSTINQPTLSTSEILGNSFIFLFAGHDTTASKLHFTLILLAMHLQSQRKVQSDIDSIVGTKVTTEWSYEKDMPRLFNCMVGAALHESLRLIPAVSNIPKVTAGEQQIIVDGKFFIIPNGTHAYLNVVGAHRNPRYWDEPSEFKPERWLPSSKKISSEGKRRIDPEEENEDTQQQSSFETTTSTSLLLPEKGSFIPFSLGARSCPGKRFAQVESVAVVATIFQRYSVELDVASWASDDEVEAMGKDEKKVVYGKAVEAAQGVLARLEQTITMKMKTGDTVPLRFVQKGKERFAGCY